MIRIFALALLIAFSSCSASALPPISSGQAAESSLVDGGSSGIKLRRLYFNLYTDSLKPVMNYYVNVEGQTPDGNYVPLGANDIILTASWGQMQGNEWLVPRVLLHDSVTFTATSRQNPELSDRVTIWIQKWKDPRDEPGYSAPGTEDLGPRRNRR